VTAVVTDIKDAHDPFDPARLRLRQDFVATSGANKVLQLKIRKPGAQEFFRVCPNPEYRLEPFAIIELKESRDVYPVDPELAELLGNECKYVTLFLTATRQGDFFFWPVKLPDNEGGRKPLAWHTSAREAAELAITKWVRMTANMSAGYYDLYEATANIPAPVWPTEPMSALLRIAFKGELITSLDHHVISALRTGA
jgi:hypothetical protein